MILKKNEPIRCADGFTMSVQANQRAYCTPRTDNAERYTEVEVGYPSEAEPLLLEWAEDPQAPTNTVYGWVPAERVSLILVKHGGIVSGDLPPGIPILTAN
tara:strand:+ start:234 stop:536 length:303 start_codon:yes stop_codon:yes gene_type:complete